MTRRGRREPIAPGSMPDRLRAAFRECTGGLTMAELVIEGKARPEDVRDEVNRLRRAGYIRVYGRTRKRRYFWRS